MFTKDEETYSLYTWIELGNKMWMPKVPNVRVGRQVWGSGHNLQALVMKGKHSILAVLNKPFLPLFADYTLWNRIFKNTLSFKKKTYLITLPKWVRNNVCVIFFVLLILYQQLKKWKNVALITGGYHAMPFLSMRCIN